MQPPPPTARALNLPQALNPLQEGGIAKHGRTSMDISRMHQGEKTGKENDAEVIKLERNFLGVAGEAFTV